MLTSSSVVSIVALTIMVGSNIGLDGALAQTLPADGSGGGASTGPALAGGGGGGGGGAGLQLTTSNSLTITVTGAAGGAGGGENASGSTGGSGSGTLGGTGGPGGGTGGGAGGLGAGGALGGIGAAGNGSNGGLGGGGGGGAGLILNGASLIVPTSGAVTGGSGGAGGGANSSFSGNLGNGGAGGAGIVSLSTGLQVSNSGTITGGTGGDAGFLGFLGSGAINGTAGAGGVGVSLAGDSASFTNIGTVRGGAGGLLNTLNSFTGSGAGGAGGAGLIISGASGTVSNSGTIRGGTGGYDVDSNVSQGGASGAGVILSGSGTSLATGTVLTNNAGATIIGANRDVLFATNGPDNGGAGVSITGNYNSLNNAGTITGGSAGSAGTAGVRVSGNNNLVITSGTITGGGSGGTVAPSVQFDGNNNTLELRAGYALSGGAKVNGTGGTLALGGTSNATFDLSRLGTSATSFNGFSAFTKTGTSTWTLNSIYTGTSNWSIQQGTLAMSSLAEVTGTASVASGAALSVLAFSRIHGQVTIADGGKLVTTTTTGAAVLDGLTLSANSILEMNVTRAGNGTGLLTLGNNGLVLDGTLNIINSSNALAAGSYRLFNVVGALTNNTMVIGSAPIQYSYTIDTSNTTFIHLLVEANTGYWNGAQTTPNGIVNGGSGIWNASTTNWTNATGTTSKVWGGYEAYFQGTPGTVTVDNAGVSAYLMHFGVDGYTLSGGPLTLSSISAAKPIVEVTTGTTTIQSVIAGTAGLDKTGAGTLVLGGANTYTGNTTITAGTLQIDGAGSILGNVANSGALVFNPSSDLTFAGTITGTGSLTKSGASKVTLTGLNTYSGTTTISAGTLQMDVTGNPVLNGTVANAGALIVNANTVTPSGLTFGGVISGTGTLTKNGAGALKLTANNTYTGLTTVTAGVLYVGFGTTTGAIAGDIVNNAPVIVGGVNSGQGVAFFRTNASTYAGVISGTGQVGVGGGGSLTLTGENTYTGDTFITGATLIIGDGGTSGSVLGNIQTNFPANPAGTVAFNRSDIVLFPGAIFGTGGLEQRGTGTLVLTGANTYSGGTTITRGTLQVGDGTSGSLPTGTNVANSGVLVFNQGADASFSGAISGTGSVTKQGPTTLTLSGRSAYSGATTVSAGTLVLAGGEAIGDLSAVTVAAGASLVSSAAEAIGSLAGAGSVTIDGFPLTVGGDNSSTTFSGVVRGTAGLIKAGTGTLTLSGINTNSGGTSVSAGRLIVSSGSALSDTANVFVDAGATLELVNANESLGAIANGGAIVLNANTLTVGGGNNGGTFSGTISGSGGLTKIGAGQQSLTGTNTFSGPVQISAGTLVVQNGAALSDQSAVTVDSGALFGVLSSEAIGSLAGAGSVATTTTVTLTTGGNNASTLFSGTISEFAGAISLVKTGTGTMTLTGANTYVGGTTISGGTLQIGNGGTTGSIVGNVTNNGALAFSRSDAVTYANAVSGSGSLTQSGGGVLTLTGANTYTGGTTISGGTLQIGNGGTTGSLTGAIANSGTLVFNRSNAVAAGNITGTGTLIQRGTDTLTLTGTNSAGGTTIEAGTLALQTGAQLSSNVQVQSGATLAGISTGPGTAQVNGVVTVADGGHISAAPVGSGNYGLSMTELVLNGTSNVDVALGANTGSAAFHAGTLTLDGTLNVTNAGGMTFGTYRIIDYDHLAANNGLAFGSLPFGFDVAIQTSVANQINLVVDPTSLFWNGATTTPDGTIHGGSGTWSASAQTNWTNAAGTAARTWLGGIAVFQGVPGTVTVDTGSGAVNVAAMQFAVDGYEVSGGALTLASAAGKTGIRVGDGTSAGTAYTATIGSVLAGTSGLDKQDLGTLVLTGTNTYTGGTTVTAGTLQIGNGVTTGSIVGDVVNNANLIFNPAAALTYSGAISGTGSLFKQGAGTLTLTGTSTYTGGTSVTGGRLVVSGGSSLSDTDGLIVGGAGTVELLDANETVGWLSGAGSVSLNANVLTVAGGGTTFSGTIGGSGGLSKTGTGTLTLTGTNTYSGGTKVSGGAVRVANAAALGTGGLSLQGQGTLEANGTFTYAGAVSLTPSAGTGGGTLQVNGTETLTLGGAVSGTGNLGKTGAGTLVLGGANTFSGAINIDAGALVATGGQAIGDTSAVNVAGGASFVIQSNETIGSLSGGGSVQLAGASLMLGGDNTSTTYSGAMSGTGGLIKTGTGTLTLTGTNTYTGATTVASGAVALTGAVSGDVTVQNLATLSGGGNVAGTVHVQNGGTLSSAQTSGLTMGGLVLAANANLAVTLGAPGATSSVFTVNGNVTLDGTLAVTPTTGFGLGTYRIVNYTGTLTDNGMALSGVPAGLAGGIQTAVANQVNLFIEDPSSPTLFWNGANTTASQVIQGGTGTWTADARTNWANASATIAKNWTGGFAVFQAAPGTVTVDNGGGQVAASGMQFASTGYLITGGAIKLDTSGLPATIRVGDGTQSGTTMVATIASALTGTGGLKKTDFGTLILTGTNTYTGGTTISGGTLQIGNGGTSGSLVGDVVNNGALAFDLSGKTSFAGSISGSGALLKAGSGTLSLTGANGYAGGTTVTGGILSGNTQSLQGNIVNNAAVEFDQASNGTYAGSMSGSGSLNKAGSGTLILTGTNTYTGGTTISGGTLQIGNGGTSGSLVGDIVNNSSLVFNRAGTYDFPGNVTGNGSVNILSGNVNFTGAGGYAGPIAISGSSLTLKDGSTSASTFTIGANSVIGGSGTIGGLIVNDGGTAAPGYSPGTLTVAGNVVFNAGSVYAVDITPDGKHDLIAASGTATLSGGAVAVAATPGAYLPGTTYTILTANGGVTGSFGSVTANFAFLDPSLSYGANNVTLSVVRNTTAFPDVGRTANQRSAATAAESLGAGNPVYDRVLQLGTEQVPAAFDSLSGEIYASSATVLQQQSGYLRDAVSARIRQSFLYDPSTVFGGPQTAGLGADYDATIWAQAYGGWGEIAGNGNAAGVERSASGVFAGIDSALTDDIRVGLVGGYGATSFRADGRSSAGDIDSYDIAVYGAARFGGLNLNAGLAHGWHDISVDRGSPGYGYGGSTSSGYKAWTTQAFGEASWRFDLDPVLDTHTFGKASIEPFAGFAYVGVDAGSFTETGSAAALRASMDRQEAFYSTLGIRLASEFTTETGARIVPHASFAWQRAFNDLNPSASMAFASGGTGFSVSGAPIARDTAIVNAGFDYKLTDSVSASVIYEGQFSAGAAVNGIKGGLKVKF